MYVCGKNSVLELLKKDTKIYNCYVNKNFSEQNILIELQKRNITLNYLDKFQLDKLVNKNHQGIIVEVADYKYASLDDFIYESDAVILILDHLEDPHNLGAIIRTCEALGVTGIIIPKNRSVAVNETVVKVSAGAAYNVKVAMVTNITMTINKLKENGFWIIGTDLDGTDFDTLDYNGKIGIIIGNEGKGMSRLVKENCDYIAKIPMKGEINSLNASVAAGILIYEATKKRR